MNSLQSLLQKGGHFLFESNQDIDVVTLNSLFAPGAALVIAYSSRQTREFFEKQTKKMPEGTAAFIDLPEHYLSEEKLQHFLEKSHFTDTETAFLIKILLWKEMSKIHSRHELSLFGEEYELWSLIACDDFPHAVRKTIVSAKVLLIPHRLLIAEVWKNIPCKTLIVEEALSLEDNLTNGLQKKFSVERLATHFPENSVEMVFGLLGIYFENHVEPFASDVILDDRFTQSLEGKKALAAAKKLHLKDFDTSLCLGDWKKSGWLTWLSMYREQLSLTSAPLFVGDFFQKSIGNISIVILKSTALSLGNDFSFLKEILSLPDEWESSTSKEKLSNLTFEIPDYLPEPNTEGYFRTCEAVIKHAIQEFGGNIFVIGHTKKSVEALSTMLIGETQRRSIALITQGVSGGIGKSIELFFKNPSRSILIGTAVLMNEFEQLEPHIRCVIFQKLPFDFSASPLGKIRPQAFPNGFEQYTLKKALLRFKQFLFACQRGEKKKIILLDTRLLTREYGEKFLQDLALS